MQRVICRIELPFSCFCIWFVFRFLTTIDTNETDNTFADSLLLRIIRPSEFRRAVSRSSRDSYINYIEAFYDQQRPFASLYLKATSSAAELCETRLQFVLLFSFNLLNLPWTRGSERRILWKWVGFNKFTGLRLCRRPLQPSMYAWPDGSTWT